MSLKNFLKSNFDTVQTLGIIFTLLFAAIGLAYQNKDINSSIIAQNLALRQENEIASGNFVIDFNNQLRNSDHSYSKIIYALATGGSLKSFSDEEIDDYLVNWELIGNLVKNKIIDSNSAYTVFSYDVERAYCSQDIKIFVTQVQKENQDPTIYGNFLELARNFLEQDKNRPCSPNFIQ